MFSLPITDLTSTGIYVSAFLFLASALLLLALYFLRWKSDLISFWIWGVTIILSGVATWFITHKTYQALEVLAIYSFFILLLRNLVPIISLFGLFFLTSMLLPSFFGLIWLFELLSVASHYLNVSWPLYFVLLAFTLVLSFFIFFNTIIASSNALVRFSSLYFPFSRLKKGWERASLNKKEPWVSIHVPCYNEPPEIVIETLDALSRLEYHNYEVIVLDNNTKDSEIWKPIEERCLKLGKHFQFYHVDYLFGAKAGALNACLALTSPHIELISVVDADYITQPDFLKKLIGFFDDPKVGFVQSCQDYRDWQHNLFKTACYYEYDMHFKLILTGQNEWDAAYTIGTMCLIRRKAFEKVGGWAEWCLTEDSEVAVRLHADGYEGYYLRNAFGYGLIPQTFESYKKQRFRWSAGPVQQFQKHWKLYLPFCQKSPLTIPQKWAEIFHSLAVFFSESLTFLINIPILAVCLWFAIVKQQIFIIPFVILFFIPFALCRNLICNWISIRLLGGHWKDHLLSSIASRSLLFTRNLAFFKAWTSNDLFWKRTNKFKADKNFERAFQSCRSEIYVAIGYIIVSFLLMPFVSFWPFDVLFFILLGLWNQILSLLCAPIMSFLSEKQLEK